MPVSRGRLPSVIAVGRCLRSSRGRVGPAAAADAPTKQQCVVANESAQDLQRAGKLIEARLRLMTCADDACPGAVRADCAEQLQAVAKALPTIVLIPRSRRSRRERGGARHRRRGAARGAQRHASCGRPGSAHAHGYPSGLAARLAPPHAAAGDRVRRDVVFRGVPPVAGGEADGRGRRRDGRTARLLARRGGARGGQHAPHRMGGHRSRMRRG